MSPTLTAHATAAGVIIGTAACMSPEQAAGIAAAPGAVTRPAWKKALPWAVTLAAVAVAVVLGLGSFSKSPVVDAAIRFHVPPPTGNGFQLDTVRPGPAVVSPDGLVFAFSAWASDNRVRIFVRELDEVHPRHPAFANRGHGHGRGWTLV